MSQVTEHDFLREALRLADANTTSLAGGPFGAVIVRDGQIIGRGANRVLETKDPTAHAEMVAIRDASRYLNHWELTGSTLYTSCEPCPMCLAAAYWARIERIVFSADRYDAAAVGFDDDFLYRELVAPVEARQLPIQQDLPGEGRQVMERWAAHPDRVPY